MHKPESPAPIVPWWRVGMVWLVLAGPAIVVAAGVATAVIAVRNADPVVTAAAGGSDQAGAPALQARNHAAAPLRPSSP